MRPTTYGQGRKLQASAGENIIARNIAYQLIRESEVPIPKYISPERKYEIYSELRQLEEMYIADLESTASVTPERLGVIRSLFGVIQVETMRSN